MMTVQNEVDVRAACVSACETYMKAMQRPFRRDLPLLFARVVVLAIVAMVPLYLAIFASSVAPVTGAPEAGPELVASRTALDAARTRLVDAARVAPPPPDAGTSLGALKEAVEIREMLDTQARNDAAETATIAQSAYVDRLRLWMAVVVFVGLAGLTLFAQASLLARHWVSFVGTASPNRLRRWMPVGTIPLVLVAAYGVLYLAEEQILRPLFLGATLDAAYNWAAGAAALVVALAFVTLFATWTYAAHYPTALQASTIMSAFDAAAQMIGKDADHADVLARVYEKVPADISDSVGLLMVTSSKRVTDLDGPMVDHGLTASQCVTVIRALSVALGIVMIVGLFVLSLALDTIAGGLAGPPDFKAAVAASADTWVLVIGLGCSAVLFLAYGLPVARLTPFVSAATKPEPAPAPPEGWKIHGSAFPNRMNLSVTRPEPDAVGGSREILKKLQWELGADPAKFLTIQTAGNHGGGFQKLMADSLGAQLKAVLGILAPTLAGGILSLLG